ncbi:TIR domain-containing protein [Microterricola viridarii]|uniref:TIR domain-containing protein n=1 Tax=Microterricola viridarii TaxID=412690 RepID=A0A1H1YLS7_9MICO|nr:TIR domain-containing protein [Microterricola viridarii]SDT22350.1 TIR domain-containing protein [Microterricola viridarii]
MADIESKMVGFWSYAHADNERDRGRITELAQLVSDEFALITGREIEIFVDREGLEWGDRWREKIDNALSSSAFFIPIITPTFFTRPECRNELIAFNTSAKELGVTELILPIVYLPVRDLALDSTDPVKQIVASLQYVSWDGLRLLDQERTEYRTAVHRLATRLAEIEETLESRPLERTDSDESEASAGTGEIAKTEGGEPEEEDDELGILDRLAELQPGIEEWTETIASFQPALESFTGPMTAITPALKAAESQANPIGARLSLLRKLSQQIEAPVERLEDLSSSYTRQLIAIDPNMRALLQLVDQGDSGGEEALQVTGSILGLAEAGTTAAEQITSVADMARKYSGLSRDLRKPFRKFDIAMRSVADGQTIIDSWRDAAIAIQSKHGEQARSV